MKFEDILPENYKNYSEEELSVLFKKYGADLVEEGNTELLELEKWKNNIDDLFLTDDEKKQMLINIDNIYDAVSKCVESYEKIASGESKLVFNRNG